MKSGPNDTGPPNVIACGFLALKGLQKETVQRSFFTLDPSNPTLDTWGTAAHEPVRVS